MIDFDEEGFPIVFADVPNSGGVTIRQTGTTGGNKAHDANSGKFTSGSKKPGPAGAPKPANVDPKQFQRMLDAAREAARLFDLPEEDQIKKFLSGRATNAAEVDVAGFLERVRAVQITDLVDMLWQKLSEEKATVKVTSPRGYEDRLIASLDESQLNDVKERLVARGVEEDAVASYFG